LLLQSNSAQLIRTAGISSADTQLKAYVNWVHHVQQDSDPNGIDVRGEPKASPLHLHAQSTSVCLTFASSVLP
jgi:hypothetical protein